MDINTGSLPSDFLDKSWETERLVSLSYQAQLCKELVHKLPVNDFGLPTGIYRPDLLPNVDADDQSSTGDDGDGASPQVSDDSGQSLFIGELLEDRDDEDSVKVRELIPQQRSMVDSVSASDLQAAYVPLSYDEGYPTLPQGMPLWGQFPFEPPQAHEVFQLYLRMAHESGLGVRMLSELPSFAIKHGVHVDMADIHEYYHLFYWGVRSRAFDMVQVASLQKQQELRAIQVQDSHYDLSNDIMSKLKDYMNDEEDFWDMMTPKTAVDLMKAAATLQRTAVGLPASGPPQHKEGQDPRGSSFEFILRQVAQKSGTQHNDTHDDNSSNLLGDILNDPEMIVHAQELILRMNKHD